MDECHSAILHDNMNISRLMFYAQQVEETRLRRKNKEAKMMKSYDDGVSNGRLEIQDKPRFKKKFTNQVPSKFPKARDDRESRPKSQKRKVLADLARNQLVESVARIIMVIALLGQTIALGVAR